MKRKFEDLAEDSEEIKKSRIVAHYNARPEYGLENRKRSPILHLKNFNNWIKCVLIGEYIAPDDAVLDLCCGKGGDLLKYIAAKVGYLVGVDIAEKSIEDFKNRYHSFYTISRADGNTFPAQLFVADCFQESICDRIDPEIHFQTVSCQFALHYAFESESKVRQAFKNISDRLNVGGYFLATLPDGNIIVKLLEREIQKRQGHTSAEILDIMTAKDLFPIKFGNSFYSINFIKPPSLDSPYNQQYIFELKDAIDACPEYLVHFPTLSALAKEYKLKCCLRKSFHSFFYLYCDHPRYHELIHQLNIFANAQPLSKDEWDIAYLYFVCVFQKIS
jgi:mRNA (guanine-N7-)-methyltransferase